MRKMLGKADSPYIISLIEVLDTQSKETIARWCLDYAEKHILPLFEKECHCCIGQKNGRRAQGDSC